MIQPFCCLFPLSYPQPYTPFGPHATPNSTPFRVAILCIIIINGVMMLLEVPDLDPKVRSTYHIVAVLSYLSLYPTLGLDPHPHRIWRGMIVLSPNVFFSRQFKRSEECYKQSQDRLKLCKSTIMNISMGCCPHLRKRSSAHLLGSAFGYGHNILQRMWRYNNAPVDDFYNNQDRGG